MHRRSLAACYSDFMTGDSLSLSTDGINRLALQLVDVKLRRPAIIFTVVHLLWVNKGHLSGSGPSPCFLLPTTGGLLLYIYTLMQQYNLCAEKMAFIHKLSSHLGDSLLCKQVKQHVVWRDRGLVLLY